uniref:NFKB inhibitor delta n=1 Tax=Latimeria chalumnae TaxID=7897 RepID=H3ABW1_LATCH
MQCQTSSSTLPGPQFVPTPITIPDPVPQDLQQARQSVGSLPIEKLLQEDEDNDTILHIYAAQGMREYTIAAAERIRELRRLDVKEHRGKTPLLVAVTANQPFIVHDLLMLGADINAVDDKGKTILHLAATYGFLEVIQVVRSIASTVNLEMRDFEGLTPLHCAVFTHNSIHRELNQDSTITTERQDELQHRSNQVAACIKLLVQMGASLSCQDIKSNKTAIHFTVQEGNVSLLKYFLEFSPTRCIEFINMKAHGNTALHMAAGLRNEKNQEEIIKLLLCHGADSSMRNLENDQAIHLVEVGEEGDKIRQLLKKGRITSASTSC